jgi:hypothetical protein
LNWQKAYIGIAVIAFGTLVFALLITRSSPSISAVYALIADMDKDAPSVPPPVVWRGKLHQSDTGVLSPIDCTINVSNSSAISSVSSQFGFFRENIYSDTGSATESLEPLAIINAVTSGAPGFAAFEKLPSKPASKNAIEEILPSEIRIPPSYVSDEKARVGREYTTLAEEQ